MHVVGLALIVGLTTVTNLRLLNVISGLSQEALLALLRLAWVGFAINALSGLALFTSQASYFVTNTPFLCKIALIILGVSSVALIQRALKSGRPVSGLLAFASISTWLGAIVAGRLIAYL